mmetsp:Transcript_10777/g.31249  ORF Transcript_10777/g.31249 Transcript_10777/m.31249 type:complete len:112 (+) Transcript_10777:1044-1379(+)
MRGHTARATRQLLHEKALLLPAQPAQLALPWRSETQQASLLSLRQLVRSAATIQQWNSRVVRAIIRNAQRKRCRCGPSCKSAMPMNIVSCAVALRVVHGERGCTRTTRSPP